MMRNRFWMLAAAVCCLLALCLTAVGEEELKAAEPLEISLVQPTAMVVDKPFNLDYTITGGTAPYDIFVEVTHNGRYVDSFDGNKRNSFTPDEAGSYTVSVTVTDAEGTQVAGRFTITAYAAGVLNVTRVNVAEGPDGASIVATAEFTVGDDNATFTFYLYDDTDTLINTAGPISTNTCTIPVPGDGTYYVMVDATDGMTSITGVKSNLLTIGLVPNFRLAETSLVSTLSSDKKSIFINQPTPIGGTAPYTYAYTCYNDASRPMNYFYDNSATVAMTPGSGGRYVVFCTVTESGPSHESITLNTGWYTLPSANGPLTVDPALSIRASSTHREIVATRPAISGGTGKYTVFYSCYNSNGKSMAFFSSDASEVSIATGENGHFNVIAIVSDGVETVYSVSAWLDLDGYNQRVPMTVGTPVSSISGDNRSIYIDQPPITGGTGTYAITYTCLDELGRTVAYFSSTSSRVAMTTGFNGRFRVRVTVTDGYETVTVETDWNYISGYTALPDPKAAAEAAAVEELLLSLGD